MGRTMGAGVRESSVRASSAGPCRFGWEIPVGPAGLGSGPCARGRACAAPAVPRGVGGRDTARFPLAPVPPSRYAVGMDAEDLRRRIEGWQRAGRRAEAVREAPADAFAAACDLWSLRPELLSLPRTDLELRDIDRVRESWRRLRARSGV